MKIKSLLFISIFLIISLIFIPNIANAAVNDIFTVDEIEYIVLSEEANNYTVSVLQYVGSSKNVTIPETVIYNENIYIVKQIGIEAFANCTTLESVVMPNSVTSTWSDIFRGCTSLKEVTLSNSLKLLQYGIFGDCISLKNIVIPDSIETIDMRAFENCSGLKSVKILNFEAEIDADAFKGCTSLTTIQGYIRSTAEEYAEKHEYDFEIIGKFDIIFDANGGTFSNNKNTLTITSGDWDIKLYEVIDEMEKPTKEGYKFLGFFDAKTGGTSLEYLLNEGGINGEQTFYAQWEKEIYLMENYENQEFTIGIDKELVYVINSNRNYGKVFIDDIELENTNKEYTWNFVEGIFPNITLHEDYLKTLEVGKHKIKFVLDNGMQVESKFTILEEEENEDTTINNTIGQENEDITVNNTIEQENGDTIVNNTTEQNEVTVNKGNKDNTPKTGTVNTIQIALIIVIISAIAILVLKRK